MNMSCANKITVFGDRQMVKQLTIDLLNSSNVTAKKVAIYKLRKLFLAGIIGILRPTKTTVFDENPQLTGHGTGSANESNKAFDVFVELLNRNPVLDFNTIDEIDEVYAQSNLSSNVWDVLSLDQKQEAESFILSCYSTWGIFANKHSTPSTPSAYEIKCWFDLGLEELNVSTKQMEIHDLDEDEVVLCPLDYFIPLPIRSHIRGGFGTILSNTPSLLEALSEKNESNQSELELKHIVFWYRTLEFYFDSINGPAFGLSRLLSEVYGVRTLHLWCSEDGGVCGSEHANNGIIEEAEKERIELEEFDGERKIVKPTMIADAFKYYGYGQNEMD